MFWRNKTRHYKAVKPVCGYKDSEGKFWDTYEQAEDSSKRHKQIEEDREMVEDLTNLVCDKSPLLDYFRPDVREFFRNNSKEAYLILHKHFRGRLHEKKY